MHFRHLRACACACACTGLATRTQHGSRCGFLVVLDGVVVLIFGQVFCQAGLRSLIGDVFLDARFRTRFWSGFFRGSFSYAFLVRFLLEARFRTRFWSGF